MDSHEYADFLVELAGKLKACPAFQMPYHEVQDGKVRFGYFVDKEGFLSAVKACGAGLKEYKGDYLHFRPTCLPLELYIYRSAICKLVKPAEYDCTPLLNDAELAGVDRQAAEATGEEF